MSEWFWTRLKHWVLDRAHPPPERVEVYPGEPGTLEHAIVHRVVLHTVDMDALVMRPSSPIQGLAPAVWVDGHGHTGCLATCRYVGRLWRAYPTNPHSALMVDSSLDVLSRFCAHAENPAPFLQELEDRLGDEEEPWLEGLDQCSLADLCWAGALAWVRERTGALSLEETPRLARWWELMQLPPPPLVDDKKEQ